MFSSKGIKKFAANASSVTGLSSFKVKLPTPAKTMFLQNCIHNSRTNSKQYNIHLKFKQPQIKMINHQVAQSKLKRRCTIGHI
ncbi:hypothetical protein Hanom_Chr08g00751131 [Helianthus anomalus]